MTFWSGCSTWSLPPLCARQSYITPAPTAHSVASRRTPLKNGDGGGRRVACGGAIVGVSPAMAAAGAAKHAPVLPPPPPGRRGRGARALCVRRAERALRERTHARAPARNDAILQSCNKTSKSVTVVLIDGIGIMGGGIQFARGDAHFARARRGAPASGRCVCVCVCVVVVGGGVCGGGAAAAAMDAAAAERGLAALAGRYVARPRAESAPARWCSSAPNRARVRTMLYVPLSLSLSLSRARARAHTR